jgi:hypothetical protein
MSRDENDIKKKSIVDSPRITFDLDDRRCKFCDIVDGHLTTCREFSRQRRDLAKKSLAISMRGGGLKKSVRVPDFHEASQKIPMENVVQSGEEKGVGTMKELLKELQQNLQIFIVQQHDKMKELMKAELKEEIMREVSKTSKEMSEDYQKKMKKVVENLEKRLPSQSFFDYAYQ